MKPKLVRDAMTREVTTLSPNDKLATAADVMQLGRVRHLPVIDDEGDLVGILSHRDLCHSALLKAMGHGSHSIEKMRGMLTVKEAMVTEIVTATPDMELSEAAGLMLERKIGCLPVVAKGALVGIITEADFLSLAGG